MTNYLKAMKKNQELQAKLKEEVTAPKTQKDSAAHDEQLLKNARALRRSKQCSDPYCWGRGPLANVGDPDQTAFWMTYVD